MKKFVFIAVTCLLVVSNCQRYYLASNADTVRYRLNDQFDAGNDTTLAALIAPYKVELDQQMQAVIGQCSKRLYKERPESLLGNWLADLLYRQASELSDQPVDAAYQNYGGIRIPELAQGPITRGKIYELMPFDNMLVIVEMPGAIVQQFFDHLAQRGGDPVSEQVRFVLQAGKADQLQLNGEAIERNRTYRIAMPDYIANGGDNAKFLAALPRENTGKLIRDLIIADVERSQQAGQSIEASLSNRIILGD